jgi:hypothetical protein
VAQRPFSLRGPGQAFNRGTATNNGGAKHIPTNEKETTIPMRIARVDIIPMTAEDLDNAAEALAVLLNHFWREHPNLAA